MRRVFGAFLALVAVVFLYEFAFWGAVAGAPIGTPAVGIPFRALGRDYPFDVGMLAGAAWALGFGLYFILSPGRSGSALPAHVPSTSRWAQRLLSQQGRSTPMATMFLLNALLLITLLFAAYVGARSPSGERYVAIFSLVAGLQIATGLLLVILALFEKPKGAAGLLLGSAVWLTGTAVGVMVFLWGQPAPQA